MDKAELTKCKRTVLRQIAKRENIKANAKSVEIIDLLLKKYPEGVPKVKRASEVMEPAEGSSIRNRHKRRRVDFGLATVDSVQGPGRNGSSAIIEGCKRIITPTPPRPDKDASTVSREIIHLLDDGSVVVQTVQETRLRLVHAIGIANELAKDIREISWMRYCIELDVANELKNDKSLWDGNRVICDAETSLS